MNVLRYCLNFVFLASLALLSACASAPMKPCATPASSTQLPCLIPPSITRHDVFHVVGPGETLWRISKMYDVRLEDIVKANKLGQVAKISMGQRLLIPNAASIRPVIPLYRSEKWKYIIVHHSATDSGNALKFNQAHLVRGFWNGLGYHFVIDNGTAGKAGGQIEVSPRWIKQQDGAHCKAGGMNEKGIGICLVGDFSRESVSERQMESLIYLVNILRKYYNVPLDHIMGHGRVSGATTECPGKRFPWDEFWSKLKASE